MIEPRSRLFDGDRVGKMEVQTVGDYADVVVFVGELPEPLTSARNHRQATKQIPRRDREAVQARIMGLISNARLI